MFYKEYKPSKTLAAYIECYWVLQYPADFPNQQELIVPGGRVELMINIGTPVVYHTGKGKCFEMKDNVYILGQRSTFFNSYFRAGYNMLGIRFRPGCFYIFSKIPASYLLNEVMPATEVLNHAHIQSWYNQLLETCDIQQQIDSIEQQLQQIVANKKVTDTQFMTLVPAIRKDCQTVSIQDFCTEHNLYYKKLERRFLQQAGYTPKDFIKISRFYTALKLIYKNKYSLTDIGHSCGYYDQSHFIKDFKTYTSFSPSEFIKERYQVPRLISSSLFV